MQNPVQDRRRFDIVAIAASAGGVSAVGTVLEQLPASFPAPIVVVQHLDPKHKSMLAEIMSRRSPLRCVQASEHDRVEAGTVYIAAPGRHLRVETDGRLSTNVDAPVHFVRPAADILFESMAKAYGQRCVGVILTGSGSDGIEGVRAIKRAGGTVIAQDPSDSQFPSMPQTAIDTGMVDESLRLDSIAERLIQLLEPENVNG